MPSHPPKLPSLLGIAAALAFSSVHARELEPVDALATASRSAAASRSAVVAPLGKKTAPGKNQAQVAKERIESDLGRALGLRVKASIHEGLGVPVFVRVARPTKAMEGKSEVRQQTPERAARDYLRQIAQHYALTTADVGKAQANLLQRTQAGGKLVRFQQQIDGIGVFRDEMTMLLGADNELLAVSGQIGSTDRIVGSFALQPRPLVGLALEAHGFDAGVASGALAEEPAEGGYTTLHADAPLTADDGTRFISARFKPTYFRLPGQLVPAYYLETEVVAEHGNDAHAWVISAVDGSVLFRSSLTAHSHSYRVWAEPDGEHLPYPGPEGRQAMPFPAGQPHHYKPTGLAPNLVTPVTVDPWLAPDATETIGNNVDAYADLVDPDGFSVGDIRANVTAPGVFDYTYDLIQSPTSPQTQTKAAVTSLFYVTNFLHDWFYTAGFDEAAGNAQQDNYGRGGLGGDRMRAEAQDYSGRNNANMSTPADGSSPRMQMFVWSRFDAKVIPSSGPSTDYPVGGADFGPQVFDLTADIARTELADGCAPLTNPGAIFGKIAVIDRGNCTFVTKVKNAQNAGAIGALVVNNLPGDGVSTMGGSDATVTIPALMISSDTGAELATEAITNVRMLRNAANDIDGTIDNAIVAHEWGHYLSNRLIGDASGISTNQARGMGEGWSDFVSLLMMVKAEDTASTGNDQFQGAYGVAGHATQNYYRAIRRYPYSTDLAVNPLNFAHISNETPLPATPTPGSTAPDNFQVHNTGEVWASMLWECYAGLLRDTLGASPRIASFTEAQTRMKRYLVTGLMLTPSAPTFTEARDALLEAMAEENADDAIRCAEGFARRGAGPLAVAPDRYDEENLGVIASFDVGATIDLNDIALDDVVVSVDNDGHLDAGERGRLRIRYTSNYFAPLSGLTLTVSSSNPALLFTGAGLSVPLPTLGAYATGEVTLDVSLAGGTSGIQEIPLQVEVSGAGIVGGSIEFDAYLRGNVDEHPLQSRIDGAEDTVSPWGVASSLAGVDWIRASDEASSNLVFHGPDAPVPALVELVSPELQVSSTRPLRISFRHRFSFETSDGQYWDGGVLEISEDGGATWVVLDASLYNSNISYGATDNPYLGEPAFVGESSGFPGFVPVEADLGMAYAGKTVRIRFATASDQSVGAYGWDIDDISISGTDNVPFTCVTGHGMLCGGLSAVAGDAQIATTGTPFAVPLTVKLADNDGAPLAGVAVNFAVQPGVAASAGSFTGSGMSAVVFSDAQGLAVAPQLTANTEIGSFGVRVSAEEAPNFVGGTHLFQLTVASAPVLGDGGVSARIIEGQGCAFAAGAQFLPLTGSPLSPPAGSAPAGVAFPYGLFDFSLEACNVSGRIELQYPAPLPAGATYWKYGRTLANPELHWYQLTVADNQLEISGSLVRFTLTDGGLGDDDITVNGVIVDQGGVGVPAAAVGPGSNVAAIPLVAPWALAALAAGLGLFGCGTLRRRRD